MAYSTARRIGRRSGRGWSRWTFYLASGPWQPETVDALVVHWINYLSDEEAAIEIPIPIGPVLVTCQIPDGVQMERIEWQYPEMREPVALEYEASGAKVRFAIPRLIAYGMSVLHLRDE